MGERFEFIAIVARAEHHESLTLALEGMQVEQHLVGREQGAEPGGDAVLKVLRHHRRAQVAVQVAIAFAPDQLMRQRIDDRNESHAAAQQRQGAAVERIDDALAGIDAADLVAMHGSADQQFRAGAQTGELMNAQMAGWHAHGVLERGGLG